MSQTISGYFTSPVTLAAGSSYASPTTLSGTINDSSFNAALYIESPWSVDITGTLSNSVFGVFGQSVATIENQGYIHASSFNGIDLFAGGTVYNAASGTIIGGRQAIYGLYKYSTTITNAGYLLGGYYGVKTGPGLISNASTGTIFSASLAVDSAEFATITNAGFIHARDSHGIGISLANGGIIANTGTIQAYTALLLHGGTFTNTGLVQGETLDTVTGTITPSAGGTAISFTAPGSFIEDAAGIVLGSIAGAGGTLQMNGGSLGEVSGFAADIFGPGAHATLGASLAGLGTISGFSPGDVLHITDQPAGSGIFIGQDLTLSFAGAYLGTIAFSGTYASNAFSVTADPAGGTDITIPCFCAGTRIATPSGESQVETLQINDLVQTLHAGPQRIKWIGTRSYDGRFCAANHLVLPIHIRRNALGQGIPARDLFVSPGHAIFYAGALIPASRLVNGTSITQLAAVDSVTYFHIELDSHEILFAENCPAESFLDQDFRAQFHNAAAFHRLYPAAAPALACLPRVESGFGLQSIQRRLGFAQTPASGPLRGFIDQSGPQIVSGWAQTIASPESPVCLDILCAGRRIARVLANQYRADLKKAGIGSGHHGFELSLPAGASLPLTVRCAATHAVLPCTEAALAA